MKANLPPRNPEGGFALLFVFLMAAVIAIGLYYELPRRAFEAQREKELLLIDRGEEYRKAVEKYMLYQQKTGAQAGGRAGGLAYPKDKEQMEKFNNVRFLRRRYLDPITRKDDWIIVKVGQNGQMILEGQEGELGENPNPFLNNPAARLEAGQTVNVALQQRASDRLMPNEQEENAPKPNENVVPKPPDPITATAQTPPPNPQQTGVNQQQTGSNNPFLIQAPTPPPTPGQPVRPPSGVAPGTPPQNANNTTTLAPGVQTGPNTAAGIMQNLTQPVNPNQARPAGGTLLGGGVAGVAPKSSMDSIIIYNEKQGYKNWRFVIDQEYLQKRMGMNQGQGQGQNRGPQQGQGSGGGSTPPPRKP